MAEAESSEDAQSSSEGAASDWGPKTWIGVITAVTGLIGALAAFYHPKDHPPDAGPGSSTTAAQQPILASKARKLLWVPADCTLGAAASIALDSCTETRTLDWLQLAMEQLRKDNQFGFGALPKGFRLEALDAGGKVNYRLNVTDRAAVNLFGVGVGYNVRKNAKDGGLHLSHDGQIIAEAWLRDDGSWTNTP